MDTIEFFKPKVTDIASMQELVEPDVANGNILDRNTNEMATTIRSYTAARIAQEVVGFVALHIHTDTLAEVRSLVVKDACRNKGIATKLIKKVIQEAKDLKLKRLLVLTYKQSFFESFGFTEIPKESIPETKIWADCIKCKHFPVCDEVSLILDI